MFYHKTVRGRGKLPAFDGHFVGRGSRPGDRFFSLDCYRFRIFLMVAMTVPGSLLPREVDILQCVEYNGRHDPIRSIG